MLPGSKKDLLFIQFAKEPRPGEVKTRMQPTLNAAQACALHCELLLWTCRHLCEAGLADVELWIAGADDYPVFEQCKSLGVTELRSQRGADLGERMYHALEDGLARYRKVILVGSDCPALNRDYLSDAEAALDNCPVVLGPAEDGGYVLIGASHIRGALFEGIRWGGATVFAETVERMTALGMSWSQLQSLADIDRPGDLPHWFELKSAALPGPHKG